MPCLWQVTVLYLGATANAPQIPQTYRRKFGVPLGRPALKSGRKDDPQKSDPRESDRQEWPPRVNPVKAGLHTDTMIPLPLDLGFSHSDPAFFQLNEGLSFALKVLSSWVTRWRRLMLGVGGGWIEISPSSLNSLSVLKISYDMPINPQCSPLCIRLYNWPSF